MLAAEVFKIRNNLTPEFLNEIFQERSVPYNLRGNNPFRCRRANSVYHDIESLAFLGPKIWVSVPDEIKTSENVDIFKNKIKKWIPDNCPWRLCRVYIQNIGFI